jgi:putative polyketide hydroxylase
MEISMREPHVLVVGAGPAGLVTAITLARLGVSVLIVERRAELSPFPRATGISLRSMELLRSWGLEDRIRDGAMDVGRSVGPRTLASDRVRVLWLRRRSRPAR